MRTLGKIKLLLCGLLLMLAAFPVFAQDDDLKNIKINRRPLMDLSAAVIGRLADKKLDLGSAFTVEATGSLDADGKLDSAKFKYTRVEGDEQMIGIVKDSFTAFNNSGYFQYLKGFGGKELHFLIVQNATDFTVSFQTELESANRARSIQAILSMLLKFYKDKKSTPGADSNDSEDLLLLNAATVVVDGKKVILKFALPKADWQKMMQRKLSVPSAS